MKIEWRFGLDVVIATFNSNGNRFFFTLVFLIKYCTHKHIPNSRTTWSFNSIDSDGSLLWMGTLFPLLSKFKQMADVQNTCDKHTFAFTLAIIYEGLHNLVWSFMFSLIRSIFDRFHCMDLCCCGLRFALRTSWQQINAHNEWIAWNPLWKKQLNCVTLCKQNIFITIRPNSRFFFSLTLCN